MYSVINSERSDECLARLTAAGDDSAFEELYDRWFDPLHDFAARVLRDREPAGEVVRASFVDALETMRRRREIEHLRIWLYAAAREHALGWLRGRKRARPSVDAEDFAQVDERRLVDPEVANHPDLAQLVWSAAAALPPEEYALLDMHLRQELTAEEMTFALGLKKDALYTHLARLRGGLEESVMLTLMMRGRGDCAAFDLMVSGERRLTLQLREQVRAHVDDCEECWRSRRRFASPVEVFGALARAPSLPGTREAVWAALASRRPRHGPGEAAWHPLAWWSGTARRAHLGARGPSYRARFAALAAGGLVLLGGVAGALALTGGRSVLPLADPAGIRSTSHEVGVPDTDRTIRMVWRREPGATAYAVAFSRDRRAIPRAHEDLPGVASSTTSRALPPGRWWFVLRTRGEDGAWTSTERRGPYVIVAAEKPAPKRAPKKRKRPVEPEPAVAPAPPPPAPVLERQEPEPDADAKRPRRKREQAEKAPTPKPKPKPKTRPKPDPEPAPAPEPELPPQPTVPEQPPLPPPGEPPPPPPGEQRLPAEP
jgi:RNA polymerase sigma factor (sigma-70 family)